MSGIYIPGMEMPRRGHTVTLTITGGGEAVVQYYDCKPQLTVPIVYMAVPVPEHGDLKDADVLFKEIGMDVRFGILTAMCIQSIIHDAPTIIPADKEGEG